MQRITGFMRKAITDYHMLRDGDRVAVGVSGGKDSVALLDGLYRLQAYAGIDFSICAVTIDPRFGGRETDYSAITGLCTDRNIPHVIKRSDLGHIIFEERRETNPCSLCARMRRGMLHDLAKANGCNKVALGHHRDDAVETFVMNLFHEGRIGCFSPVSYLSRKDLTLIRPLVLAPEREVANAVQRSGLPVVKSKCPVDGATAREDTKNWLREMDKNTFPGLSKRLFGAICRARLDGF